MSGKGEQAGEMPGLGDVLARNLGTLAQDMAGVVALVVLLVAGLGLPGLM